LSEGLDSEGEAIVFATDRMVSRSYLGQFEHNIEKYRKITPTAVAMVSGNLNNFQRLFDNLNNDYSYDTLQNKIYQNIINERDANIEKNIFSRFKIDHQSINTILMKDHHNEFVTEMLNEIKDFDFSVSVLLAGFKGASAHISVINEKFIGERRDISFSAIGSGTTQAINTLYFQKHSKTDNMRTTLYNVYKAKRNSEVAVGVGKETDLFIMSSSGSLYKIDENNIKKLAQIYNKEMKYGKESKYLDNVINSLTKIND
jgi:20S proteasome alpha/beta subunit